MDTFQNHLRKYKGDFKVVELEGGFFAKRLLTNAQCEVQALLRGPNPHYTISGQVTSVTLDDRQPIDLTKSDAVLAPTQIRFNAGENAFMGTVDHRNGRADYTGAPNDDDWKTITVSVIATVKKGMFFGTTVVLEGTMTLQNADVVPGPGHGDDTGFLQIRDGKYHVTTGSGAPRPTEFWIFQDEQRFWGDLRSFQPPGAIDEALASWQSLGFKAGCLYIGNQWHLGPGHVTNKNVDRGVFNEEAFALVAEIIMKAGEQGVHIHTWIHGDASRRNAPSLHDGVDFNERRLLKLIAQTYGDLPYCSFGLGFDLQEWRNDRHVSQSMAVLKENCPNADRRPLFMGRGFKSEGVDIYSISGLDIRDKTSMLNAKDHSPTGAIAYQERHQLNRTSRLTEENLLRFFADAKAVGGVGMWTGSWRRGNSWSQFQRQEYWERITAHV